MRLALPYRFIPECVTLGQEEQLLNPGDLATQGNQAPHGCGPPYKFAASEKLQLSTHSP